MGRRTRADRILFLSSLKPLEGSRDPGFGDDCYVTRVCARERERIAELGRGDEPMERGTDGAKDPTLGVGGRDRYKEPMSTAEARSMMQSECGSQLAPQLLDVFFADEAALDESARRRPSPPSSSCRALSRSEHRRRFSGMASAQLLIPATVAVAGHVDDPAVAHLA